MERVEKLSEAGDAYSRLELRATVAAAFGRVRVEEEVGIRRVAVRALLATAPAVARRDSIVEAE